MAGDTLGTAAGADRPRPVGVGAAAISVSELLAQPPKRPEGASVTGYFMAGLTAMVGFLATLSLNIPDFSRYARSQKDQIPDRSSACR